MLVPTKQAVEVAPQPEQVDESLAVGNSVWKLVVVFEGRGKYLLDGVAYDVSEGDAFVVPPGGQHSPLVAEGLQLFELSMGTAAQGEGGRELASVPGYLAFFRFEPRLRVRHALAARLQLGRQGLATVMALVRKLELERLHEKPGFEQVAKGLLCELSVECARQYANMLSPLSDALVRLSPLLFWLDEHYEGHVTLVQLVATSEMSQSTVQRCFRKCFGVPPLGYLLELRMNKAKSLLRDTEAKVREIAPSVGIDDANYFARRFRQHSGLEPTAYRARYRQRLTSLPHHG